MSPSESHPTTQEFVGALAFAGGDAPRLSEPGTIHPVIVCANCSAEVHGEFCSACGQHRDIEIPTIRQYLHQTVMEFFALDSKIFHSLIPLVFKPGHLTLEYIRGRRARYLLPFRLYVVLGIVMFFIISKFQPFDVLHTWFHGLNNNLKFGSASKEETARALDLFNGKVSEFLPTMLIFVSIPSFALLLKLLYKRRKLRYTQHLVFSFHLFSFMLLALTPGVLTRNYQVQIAGIVLCWIYLAVSMHKVYRAKWYIELPLFLLAGFGFMQTLLMALISAMIIAVVFTVSAIGG